MPDVSITSSDQLSKNYVYELIKGCLINKRVLDVCKAHLKFEYLTTDIQKKVLKYIFDTDSVLGSTPTLGMIGQQFNGNKEAMAFLAKVRDINVEGKQDVLLQGFETFIKDVKLQALHANLAELYNADKQKEAIELLKKESDAITNFSIQTKNYIEVFTGFEDRMKIRERRVLENEAAPLLSRSTWGILDMDKLTGGGPQKGRSFLGMAVSGGSKSLYLKWHALANARIGKRVVFFQGEDTEENAMTGLDAAWTGITASNLEHNNIPEDKWTKIIQTKKLIEASGGRLYVIAEEEFGKLSIEDANEIIKDIIKKEGPIDEALFDYLEIMTTKGNWGKGESAERRRREDVANQITQMSTIHNIVTGTMTQAADLKPEQIKDPDFVMTRHHASEFKGVVKPFSYFFTFNATPDEYEAEELRIHFDKVRGHKAKKTIKIIQSRGTGRFIDSGRTGREIQNDLA